MLSMLLFVNILLIPSSFANQVRQNSDSAVIILTPTHSVEARANASPFPYGDALPNEFKWRNWDPENDNQKKIAQRIHKAFEEWHAFAKEGLVAASDPKGNTFNRWFGDQSKDNAAEIKQVFANTFDASTGKATNNIANMICDYKDFKNFCASTTAAYTMPDTGEFHICQYGLDRKLSSELDYANMDKSCSAKMRSLPMTLMHEMTHVSSIGEEARGGFGIIDLINGKGAYDCFALSDSSEDNNGRADNAQNYAWLAGEAYWSKECSVKFSDPVPGVRSTGQDETDSMSSRQDPTCMGVSSFSQETANAGIARFCSEPSFQDLVIVPAVSLGTNLTSDGRHKTLHIEGRMPVDGESWKEGIPSVWFNVYFAQSGCVGMFRFDEQQCLSHFRAILNTCGTADKSTSTGGVVQDVCAVYQISVGSTWDHNPVFLLSDDPVTTGEFVCTETDVSALGPKSPLADTCTCWYDGMTSVVDVFNKPKGGCSTVRASDDPQTN